MQQGGDTSTTSANVLTPTACLGRGSASAGQGECSGLRAGQSTPGQFDLAWFSADAGSAVVGIDRGVPGRTRSGGAALATVLGQTLLSPVLGNLTDVMGDRLQIALYLTYVNPEVKDRANVRPCPFHLRGGHFAGS